MLKKWLIYAGTAAVLGSGVLAGVAHAGSNTVKGVTPGFTAYPPAIRQSVTKAAVPVGQAVKPALSTPSTPVPAHGQVTEPDKEVKAKIDTDNVQVQEGRQVEQGKQGPDNESKQALENKNETAREHASETAGQQDKDNIQLEQQGQH